MRHAQTLLASAVAVGITACSTVKVETEWDKATNFNGYRTYTWIALLPGPEPLSVAQDPRIKETLLKTVDSGLTAKGLGRVDPDQAPDLLVAVHAWAERRLDVRSYGYGYAPSPYFGMNGMYPAAGGLDVREYRDGTLLIDLVDAKTHTLIWRGTATGTFSPGAEPKTIAQAVEQTLAKYPPPLS